MWYSRKLGQHVLGTHYTCWLVSEPPRVTEKQEAGEAHHTTERLVPKAAKTHCETLIVFVPHSVSVKCNHPFKKP